MLILLLKNLSIHMNHRAVSIRPFIGSKDYTLSRGFYKDLGFEESVLSHNMCYFHSGDFGFYLQDAYVRDWVDNTMVFMEVVDVNQFWTDLVALDLPKKYPTCRVIPVKDYDWGKECFLHDPSGILWHFGSFY